MHQALRRLMINRVVSSTKPPHFCRARSRPLICNARRHIPHHSTSPTSAAALAQKRARNATTSPGNLQQWKLRDQPPARATPGTPEIALPRTVNGTGHTGPSEFCATSI